MPIKLTPQMKLKTLRDKRQQLKREIEDKQKELVKANVAILKELRAQGKKEWVADGLSTQIIQKHRQVYDWQSIQESVPPEVWSEIIQEIPSPESLHAAIARGKVKVEDVAEFITEEKLGDEHIKVDKAKSEGE